LPQNVTVLSRKIAVYVTNLPDDFTIFLNSFVYHNFKAIDQKMTEKSGKNTFICEIILKSEGLNITILAIQMKFIALRSYPVQAIINLI
jgi:hypothetical protein